MDRTVQILKMAKIHYKFGVELYDDVTIEDLRNTKLLIYDKYDNSLDKSCASRTTNGFKFMTMTIDLLMNFKLSKNNPSITSEDLELVHAKYVKNFAGKNCIFIFQSYYR